VAEEMERNRLWRSHSQVCRWKAIKTLSRTKKGAQNALLEAKDLWYLGDVIVNAN
jgi:hypothetical protein